MARSAFIDYPINDNSIYEAVIVSHLDPKSMGNLLVEILRYTSAGDIPERTGQLMTVRYASPFYGVTPQKGLTANDGFQYTQKSYGFWAVPPDVGTKVLVLFAEGHAAFGYWIACIPDEGMNFMVPGGGQAVTELTTADTPDNLQGKKLPVGEYNKMLTSADQGVDATLYEKPYNRDFEGVLEVQGLLFDEARGLTTSSARREVPSMVFGMSTPGPLDKRNLSPSVKYGSRQGSADVPYSRLGGHSFVMDDGNDKLIRKTHASDGPPIYTNVACPENPDEELCGDETIPHNELTRWRTRTGHQILMHNSEDLIYIANSRGTAWIELSSDGKIDIHADDSISIQTEQDINITAERDVNIEAGRNINMNADGRWREGDDLCNTVRNGEFHLETRKGTTLYSQAFTNIESDTNLDVLTHGQARLESEQDTDIKSHAKLAVEADQDANFTSRSNLYMQSAYDTVMDALNWFGQFQGDMNTSVSGNSNTDVGRNKNETIAGNSAANINGNMGVISKNTILETLEDLNIRSTGETAIKAVANLFQNSPGKAENPAARSTGTEVGYTGNSPDPARSARSAARLERVTLPRVYPGEYQPRPYESILTRAPQHEPWPQHENMDPYQYKPEFTDREKPGTLDTATRLITPDPFRKCSSGNRETITEFGTAYSGFGTAGPYEPGSVNTLGFDGGGAIGGGTEIIQGDFRFGPNLGPDINGCTPPGGWPDGLAPVTSANGTSVEVAAIFAPIFQELIDRLEGAGYPVYSMHGYCHRPVARSGGSRWSYHAFGCALDINPSGLPESPGFTLRDGSAGRPNGYYSRSNLPARLANTAVTDMPVDFVQDLIRELGLGWGANWPTTVDAMHFSVAQREGGAWNIDKSAGPRIPLERISGGPAPAQQLLGGG